MRMNTSIPTMGQQPDIVGSATRGFEAGRRNRLADVYNQHGAGIASGDQNALAALAQFDPTAAMQAQRGHQVMQHADAQEGRTAKSFEMQLDEYARGLDAAQAAEQAARIEQGLVRATQLYHAGNLEGVNAILTQAGEQPISDLQQFPAIAAQYEKAFTVLKNVKDFNAPDKPADEYGRYVQEEQAAGRQPLSRIDFAKAKQKSSSLSVDKDGNVTLTEGPQSGGDVPKLTVDAAKNSGFLIRTQESNSVLNELEEQGLNFGQQNAGALPLGLGNYLRDENFQKFDQARRDFVNAILRRESGAVISDQEFENANQQYFPVPGDSPEVIQQKRRNRETAIQGLRVGSGDGAAYVDRLKESEQGGKDVTPDFGAMTDDELQKWIAENE